MLKFLAQNVCQDVNHTHHRKVLIAIAWGESRYYLFVNSKVQSGIYDGEWTKHCGRRLLPNSEFRTLSALDRPSFKKIIDLHMEIIESWQSILWVDSRFALTWSLWTPCAERTINSRRRRVVVQSIGSENASRIPSKTRFISRFTSLTIACHLSSIVNHDRSALTPSDQKSGSKKLTGWTSIRKFHIPCPYRSTRCSDSAFFTITPNKNASGLDFLHKNERKNETLWSGFGRIGGSQQRSHKVKNFGLGYPFGS
jgi:hypothetical protein